MSERHALAHASGPAPAPAPVIEAWSLERFAGRLLEWSGAASSAALTLAFGLVHEAQRRGEPAVWIGGLASGFYPPDVAAAGIDLAAFPVIWCCAPERSLWSCSTSAPTRGFRSRC